MKQPVLVREEDGRSLRGIESVITFFISYIRFYDIVCVCPSSAEHIIL